MPMNCLKKSPIMLCSPGISDSSTGKIVMKSNMFRTLMKYFTLSGAFQK